MLLILAQLCSTLYMVGLIWFVQLVHYPLHGHVGTDSFASYQRLHMQWTSYAVGPAMLIEAVSTVALLLNPPQQIPNIAFWIGLGLLLMIWGSTGLLQVPYHEQLTRSFSSDAHSMLVWSNWIRTFAWSARGLLVLWFVYILMQPSFSN